MITFVQASLRPSPGPLAAALARGSAGGPVRCTGALTPERHPPVPPGRELSRAAAVPPCGF